MKFSVMSLNANPTARPTMLARPRTESTACVRFRIERPKTRPPSTIAELISEPATDRSITFLRNGASSVSA